MQSEQGVDARGATEPSEPSAGAGPQKRARSLPMLAALLVPVGAGLVASSILLVDYMSKAPVFCDEGGCDKVKASARATILGIDTPLLGVIGFVLLGALTLMRGEGARRAQAVIAAGGALFAAYLLYYQAATVGAFCKFCVVADASMITLAAAAFFRWRRGWDAERKGEIFAGAGVMLLAVAVPLGIGFTRPAGSPSRAGLPPGIAQELAQTPKGQITIIDFVDFECPWCRKMHAALAPLLEKYKDRIRLVRKHVPLSFHTHAIFAARAECCAEAQGKADEMAEALFVARPEDLTAEGCAKLAESLGAKMDAYKECVMDAKTTARIEADSELFQSSESKGLPTLWINGTRIEGAREPEELRKILEEELK